MISADQYEVLIYTTEKVQNFWQMIDKAPVHVKATEQRLVREMQNLNTTNTEIGHLFH